MIYTYIYIDTFCLVDVKKHSFLTSCVFWFVFLNASSHLCFRCFTYTPKIFSQRIQTNLEYDPCGCQKNPEESEPHLWRAASLRTMLLMSARRPPRSDTSLSRLSRLSLFRCSWSSKSACRWLIRSSVRWRIRSDSVRCLDVPSTTCCASLDRFSASLVMLNAPARIWSL